MTSPAFSEAALARALFASLARSGRLRGAGVPGAKGVVAAPAFVAPESPAVTTVSPAIQPRGDRMTRILRSLCLRGGFAQAAVADLSGLSLADSGGPFAPEVLAAFAGVAAGALEQAGLRLERSAANNLSLDTDDLDKVVARRFESASGVFLLLVFGAQDIDVRAEVELSIEEVIAVLDEAGPANGAHRSTP